MGKFIRQTQGRRLKVLSVGCGGNEKYRGTTIGDVNADVEIPVVKLPNFVRASIEHLPFKSDTFDFAKAYNVLEHVKDWKLGLEETLRVSKVGAYVRVDGIFIPVNWLGREHEWVNIGRFFLRRKFAVKILTFWLNWRFANAFFTRFANYTCRWNFYFVDKKTGKWVKLKP